MPDTHVTDVLIAQLSADLRPVRRLAPAWQRAAVWLAAVLWIADLLAADAAADLAVDAGLSAAARVDGGTWRLGECRGGGESADVDPSF